MKHKRKRILLLFGLGIVLPSLLLGYFAFRGFRNDQALLERERLEEHQLIADRITAVITSSLLDCERMFLTLLAAEEEDAAAFSSSLTKLKQQEPLIEEIFSVENSQSIRFPSVGQLFLEGEDVSSPSAFSLTGETRRIIQRGEALEFQEKNHPQALREYRRALSRLSEPAARADVLSKIARIQKKSGRNQEALTTYRALAGDYGQIKIRDGVPWGLAARFEMGFLQAAGDDPAQAYSGFTQLYRDLLQGQWALGRGQFDYYVERIRGHIEEILSLESSSKDSQSLGKEYSKLVDEEKTRRMETERRIVFKASAAAYLEPPSTGWEGNPTGARKRFFFSIGRQEFLVSWLGRVGSTGENWGLLIDPGVLRSPMMEEAVEEAVSPADTAWIVRKRDGDTILSSPAAPTGPLTIRSDFPGGFPPWTLEFYGSEFRFFETVISSRRGIYFYMFILIGGILIFGLIYSIRTFTHELELSRMKSDFVSTVSHEFKSPLTSIRQIAEMLVSGRVPSEDRRQKYYEILLQQSERLSLLIENVLSFAKMEEGKKKFVFAPTDIEAMLQDIVSEARDRLAHAGFGIELEIPKQLPEVSADHAALSQSITNLLDNAAKYSGDSRKIEVKASVEGPFMALSVRDFGMGISKHEQERVFDRFYRGGDELTRTIKGSGLGLTLVKQIVEAHKGLVKIESQPEKGSKFSILLPLEKKED